MSKMAGGSDATLLPIVQSMSNEQIENHIVGLEDEWLDLKRQLGVVNKALQICEDVLWRRANP